MNTPSFPTIRVEKASPGLKNGYLTPLLSAQGRKVLPYTCPSVLPSPYPPTKHNMNKAVQAPYALAHPCFAI